MKTKKQFIYPPIEGSTPGAILQLLTRLGQQLTTYFRDIFDDLTSLQFATPVDSLPTAAEALRGRILILKGGAGVSDSLKVCIKNAADTYEWKTITIS